MLSEVQTRFECTLCHNWLCNYCYEILSNYSNPSCPNAGCIDFDRSFRYREIQVIQQARARVIAQNPIHDLYEVNGLAGDNHSLIKNRKFLTICLTSLMILAFVGIFINIDLTQKNEMKKNIFQPFEIKITNDIELQIYQKIENGWNKIEKVKNKKEMNTKDFIKDLNEIKKLNRFFILNEEDIKKFIKRKE